MTPAKTAKTPCIFHRMPSGCIHGAIASMITRRPRPLRSSGQMPSPNQRQHPCPKFCCCCCCCRHHCMISPSQSFGIVKWCADTGAGRHMMSYEDLSGQGFQHDAVSNFANYFPKKNWSFPQVVVRSAFPRQFD